MSALSYREAHREARPPADRYLAVWNRYRRAETLRRGAYVALVAVTAAAFVFHFALYAIFPVFWSAAALSVFRLRGPRCPRCDDDFFARRFLPGAEGTECATCGLAFGASEHGDRADRSVNPADQSAHRAH